MPRNRKKPNQLHIILLSEGNKSVKDTSANKNYPPKSNHEAEDAYNTIWQIELFSNNRVTKYIQKLRIKMDKTQEDT